MTLIEQLESRLRAVDASFIHLSSEEAIALWQRWREAFARPVREARGVWVFGAYHWHAFSYRDVPSVAREEAVAAYASAWNRRLKPKRLRDVFILPFEDEELAYRASSIQPPDLGNSDVLVVPIDFAWTMAFTHEDGWLGPYFSEAAWQHPTAEMRSWSSPPRVKRKR
jgi:hypothetical protein